MDVYILRVMGVHRDGCSYNYGNECTQGDGHWCAHDDGDMGMVINL